MNWKSAGRSVCGASHRRRQLPNQDAIAWRVLPDALVLGVADGHGSAASFRSAEGASIAVNIVTDLLAEWPEDALCSLPQEVLSRWQRRVTEHLLANPVDEGTAGDPYVWYGSTLLGAAARNDRLLLLQLGDGDILIVTRGGEVERPWPRDRRFLGGETPSLAGDGAVAEMRVAVRSFSPEDPLLVILATDGYANSFRDDAGFLQAGKDIIQIIQQDGIERVEVELEEWLRETSDLGSGDDITAGILWWPGGSDAA